MKKRMMLGAVLILVIIGTLFIGSGYSKRTDVVLTDYSVAADGSYVTIRTSLAGSMGYIRDVMVKRSGENLYLSFYTAFGGLNSKIGAKDTFKIMIDPSCKAIYFDRGEAGYAMILKKDESTNTWTDTAFVTNTQG